MLGKMKIYITPRSISWFIGLRYTLSRKRSRSVAFISRVAMSGIVLGVALLIVVLSVMNGFDRELRERILSIMPQVTLYHIQGIEQWQPLREQLLERDDIVAAAPFVELQGMANMAGVTEPLLIYGVDAELESSVSIIERFMADGALKLLDSDPSTIILGRDLASKLGVLQGGVISIIIPRAGQHIQAPAIRRMTVISLLDTGTEIDNSLALVSMAAAASLTANPSVISGLHIKTDDLFGASALAQTIESQLPYGFYSSDWTRTHGNIYYAIRMSKNLVALLLLLIITIAAFNVVSTLVMVVIDKQGDIAILRTLGMGTRQVLSIFMIQGALIGVMGTFIGGAVGVVMALFIKDAVALIEHLFNIHFLKTDIYPISYLPSDILWVDVMIVVIVSLLMSFLATLYPAWRAAQVKPGEALRYE